MSSVALSPGRPSRPFHLWLLVGLMLVSMVSTEWLRPTRYWADVIGKPDLQTIVPKQFGEWELTEIGSAGVVDPQQQEALDVLYDATLTRVYRHQPSGRLMMLSIAYGRDQNTATAVHAPEMCYRSQGFRVDRIVNASIASPNGPLKATRLMTARGTRVEPVTYFIRVGHSVARGTFERHSLRLEYALKGYLAEGLLFRVSEVTTSDDAYGVQERFISDLLSATEPEGRKALIGERAAES